MSPKPAPLPNSIFDPALDLARRGRWADAIAHVERELATAALREALLTPAALALGAVARLAERASDLAAAERALELAVRSRPRFADLHLQLGCVRMARQRRPEARRAFEQALAINPRYVAARAELAMLDAREGMIGEALGALRTLAQDTGIGDERAFTQGMKRLEHAQWDEADALLRRALRLGDPELTERLDRFHAWMKQDEPQKAADELQGILPRYASYPDLHGLLGGAELRLGHVDDALASLGRALELHPEFHEARFQFALALDAAGMSAAAMDQMSLVLQHAPEHAEARAWWEAHDQRGNRSGTRI